MTWPEGPAACPVRNYLETDIRLTADRELVCFHDATLDRVTGGRGPLALHTLASLCRLRVEDRAPIPTLAEALGAFPEANFTVDLKDRVAIAPLTKLLRHSDFRERVCVAGAWAVGSTWCASRYRACAPPRPGVA